jgi:hypothetical protein
MSLPVFQFAITDFEGNALPGAEVTVSRESDGSYAELYEDREAVTLISALGTTTADDDGVVEFFIAPGVYRVVATSGAKTRTYKYLTVHPLDGLIQVSGTSRTLSLPDAGNYLRFTSDSAVTVTIPTHSSVNFPLGAAILCRQAGAGQVTFSGATGVTVNAPFDGTPTTPGQGAVVWLRKVASNEWDVLNNKVTSGNVIGPTSATDNALARYDGTTGELLQDSSASLDDLGNLNAPTLKEGGTALESKYARLGADNRFTGQAEFDGSRGVPIAVDNSERWGFQQELSGSVLTWGTNIASRFGGTDSANRGVAFRLDTRSDQPTASILVRTAGSTTQTVDGIVTQTGNVKDYGGTARRVGWKPAKIEVSGSRNFLDSDLNHLVQVRADITLTMPSNLGQDGDTILIHVIGTATLTLAQGTNVAFFWAKGGSETTGNRTVAKASAVTLMRSGGGSWILFGNGIS